MQYTAKNEEGSGWNVVDERDAIVYEDITELEALTITEILNNNDGDTDWDAVSADWRWAVLVQIRQLAERLDQLTSPAPPAGGFLHSPLSPLPLQSPP